MLTAELATTALDLWCGDIESLQFLASANFVCSFSQAGQTRYLRLISSRNRTREQIEAELDFIAFLFRGGINAMRPVAAVTGRLIEEIPSPHGFLFACAFEKARGQRFRYDLANFKKEHFRSRGRTLGQIHALSKDYAPSGTSRRFAWDDDPLLLDIADYMPDSEIIVWRHYDAMRRNLREYPKSRQTYGLIHGDFGESNYRYQGTRLNVFDFDDCCYHWFAYDLAITIYPHGWRKEGLQLLDWLLEGYSEYMPSNLPLADVTKFCQWRLLYVFLVQARKWGFRNLSEEQSKWFAQRRANIASGYRWCG